MHAYRTHTCGALRPDHAGRRSAFRAGFTACATMAGCCSSICATITASRRSWPIPIRRLSRRRKGARRMGGPRRRQGQHRARPAPSTRPGDRRDRGFRNRDRGAVEGRRTAAAGVRRSRLSRRTSRLKYRFLDLRRETMHQQHHAALARSSPRLRRRMSEQGFTEFQTPILTASSPEGARDFLVPSRLHPGKFYALPQAPQQYKQLLMVAGFDRYFQIAPCFRDEDAARRPLPWRVLPARHRDELRHPGGHLRRDGAGAARRVRGVRRRQAGHAETFPRIPYDEAMRKYGSDKPDLRNPIEMQDVSEQFARLGLQGLRAACSQRRQDRVWAIPAPTGGSRAFCDRMNSWAQGEGQPGLGYIFWREGEEGAGPIAKNIGPERTEAIRNQLGLGDGDAVLLRGGRPGQVLQVRRRGAQQGSARNSASSTRTSSSSAWIVDFPIYRVERGREEDRLLAQPVLDAAGRPGGARRARIRSTIKAYQYDIVCNGFELVFGRDPQP